MSIRGIGITYEELRAGFKKGLRSRNWKKLRAIDKALYRAAMWYAKRSGSIVNAALVEKLFVLVEKLKETKGMRVFRRGVKKAAKLLEEGEGAEVFVWAPQLKQWLRDPDYIFWLGAVKKKGNRFRRSHWSMFINLKPMVVVKRDVCRAYGRL